MRISFDFDTELMQLADIETVRKIFDTWEEMLAKEPVKADPKEEKAALDTVKEIIKEPVAKKEEPEVVTKPEEKTKKKWNEKQKQDIQAIKDAVKRQKELKGGEVHNIRKDIDDSLIVYMKDEQNMKPKEIAKQLGCCEQTVWNRYYRAKRKNK